MEAQSYSHYSVPENPEIQQQSHENQKFKESDNDFNIQLQRLIEEGLPVFVFEDMCQKEAQKIQPNQNDEKPSFANETILTYNRKAKSLEELSKKFIEHFQGKDNNMIQLDKIVVELGVERRRIYDVINILESLNVVMKKGKNNYEWRGLCEAVKTINVCSKEGQNFKIQNFRKEKSLEYLASGFLQLFINWKPAISLQQAARHMMKEIDEAAIKTKVRRLYDIINVFRSLGLVRKASLPSKKPGYEWAGTSQLQHMIIRKQYCDQNTGLNELHQEEDFQNIEEKVSSTFQVKNGVFSPFVCPQISKSSMANFKLVNDTKDPRDSEGQKSQKDCFNEDLFMQTHEFPIFRRTTSAFTLVASGKKQHQ